MEEENAQIPWPSIGDRLFTGRDDWQNNAFVAHKYSNFTWNAYAEGYKRSADLIVAHVNNESRIGIDYLVYPVVFLYRQYIELMLKLIIIDGNLLLNLPDGMPKVHSLDVLWTLCRKIVRQVWSNNDEETLLAVDGIIQQFCEVDPSSMTFRYPTDKQETPFLNGLVRINLLNLGEIMEKLASFLDSSTMGISAMLEQKKEWESAYRDYTGEGT